MRVQLPRSGVVSALTAMRGHVADDSVPFAITVVVVGTAQIPCRVMYLAMTIHLYIASSYYMVTCSSSRPMSILASMCLV